MKILKSVFALALLLVFFSSCDEDDCKMCEASGDPMGELCDDDLREAESTPGVRCR